MKVSGKVYLLKATGHPWYKVGKSIKSTKRLRWLYTQLPFEVELIHAIDTDNIGAVEDHFKRLFRSKRIRGEWYNLSADEVEIFCNYAPLVAPGPLGLLLELRRRVAA